MWSDAEGKERKEGRSECYGAGWLAAIHIESDGWIHQQSSSSS